MFDIFSELYIPIIKNIIYMDKYVINYFIYSIFILKLFLFLDTIYTL